MHLDPTQESETSITNRLSRLSEPMGAGDVAQLGEYLPSMHGTLGLIPSTE